MIGFAKSPSVDDFIRFQLQRRAKANVPNISNKSILEIRFGFVGAVEIRNAFTLNSDDLTFLLAIFAKTFVSAMPILTGMPVHLLIFSWIEKPKFASGFLRGSNNKNASSIKYFSISGVNYTSLGQRIDLPAGADDERS